MISKENKDYDPTPCCTKWKEVEDSYYCKVHMNQRMGKYYEGYTHEELRKRYEKEN